MYPYGAGFPVYEGDWDWDHLYQARFELWFLPDAGGGGRKLLDTTQTIAGWQR